MVSIIVPVYNAEKYVVDCINSILAQTYRDIEVLVVDDGSTDSSAHLIDKIAKSDNRVVAFHLANGGVARARNYGISKAKGEYLTFVDSDDLIDAHFVEFAVNSINNAEYVSSAFETFNESDKVVLVDYMKDFQEIVTIEDYLKIMVGYQAGAYWGANWGKLYVTQIIKESHIEFEPEVNFAEDFRFNIRYLKHVHKIALLHSPCYYYRVDSVGSLSKMSREPIRYWTEYYVLFERYLELYCTHGIIEKYKEAMSRFIVGAYISVLMESVYFGNMSIKSAIKVCNIMGKFEALKIAAEICTHSTGRIGRYARWISRHHGYPIVIEMRIRRILKNSLQ